MSEDQEEEPSIEEILDSIRQIISDDDEEEGGEEAAVEAPTEEPAAEPAAEAPPEEPAPEPEAPAAEEIDAIELTERVEDEPDAAPEDDFTPEIEPESIEIDMQEAEENMPADPVAEPDDISSLLTNTAETAAYEGFTELAKKTAIVHNGITVEEIVRTELRPLLKDWLDKHLPSIIERLVQEELERVAKRAADD